MQHFNIDAVDPDSFILILNNKAYQRSTAALLVIRKLNSPLKLFYGFIIVPPFIRNALYNLVARNRYEWFGKRDTCMLPDANTENLFLT